MTIFNSGTNSPVPALLALALLLTGAAAWAADGTCEAAEGFDFVCGMQNAEDLVRVPETDWIIASSLAPGGGLYAIDAAGGTWSALYPGVGPRAEHDLDTYGACPGAPDPASLVTHGLDLRRGTGGRSTLYVVGHGGREAIEVFEVDASGATPALTWTGCVLFPAGMAANSVASLSDGSLVATVPLHPGRTIAEAMARKPTGAVYRWSPADAVFRPIAGTELPYANGVEVSADDSEIYVASSGLFNVTAFSNSDPARVLRTTTTFDFVPDNLHMDADGQLVTAGLAVADARCGDVTGPGEFDLEAFAACPRPFVVWAIDPGTLQGRALVRSPAIEEFSNVTMALRVGGEVWIGTFSGDRVARRSLKQF
jgi:hypothetical protein